MLRWAYGAPPAWRGCTAPVGGRCIDGAGVQRDRGSTIAVSEGHESARPARRPARRRPARRAARARLLRPRAALARGPVAREHLEATRG